MRTSFFSRAAVAGVAAGEVSRTAIDRSDTPVRC
jgi:hypothetical protein